jgi:hypothetical protein
MSEALTEHGSLVTGRSGRRQEWIQNSHRRGVKGGNQAGVGLEYKPGHCIFKSKTSPPYLIAARMSNALGSLH